MTKVFFILGITAFFLALIQITGLWGISFLDNIDPSFTAPSPPTSILDTIAFVVNNFLIFFQLMFASSSFFLFGSVVILSYSIAMLWAILELINGV